MQKSYWIFGGRLDIIVDETQTGGNYDLIDGTFAKGVEVPLHRHTKYSEVIIVKEGELTVFLTGKTVVLKPGEEVFIPIGVPHAIANTYDGETKAFTVASPSAFADLIRKAGIPGTPDGAMPQQMNDMELFIKVSAEVGDELLGGPGSRP